MTNSEPASGAEYQALANWALECPLADRVLPLPPVLQVCEFDRLVS